MDAVAMQFQADATRTPTVMFTPQLQDTLVGGLARKGEGASTEGVAWGLWCALVLEDGQKVVGGAQAELQIGGDLCACFAVLNTLPELEACRVGDGSGHGRLRGEVGTGEHRMKFRVSIPRPSRKTMWPVSRAKLCGR
jgi:hypothetical protein